MALEGDPCGEGGLPLLLKGPLAAVLKESRDRRRSSGTGKEAQP